VKRRPHRIPYELHGLATLMVDYLSRWGEEMELLSVLLATLIIGLLFDMRGYLDNFWIGVIFAFVVAMEFIFVAAVAYKRRELELELWRAIYEVERSLAGVGSGSDDGEGPRR